MAFGVAFSIKANLGTSPISSVPYVVSLFALLTVGTATIWQQWFICLTGILLVAVGVREGTVAAALLVGLIAKRIGKVLQK